MYSECVFLKFVLKTHTQRKVKVRLNWSISCKVRLNLQNLRGNPVFINRYNVTCYTKMLFQHFFLTLRVKVLRKLYVHKNLYNLYLFKSILTFQDINLILMNVNKTLDTNFKIVNVCMACGHLLKFMLYQLHNKYFFLPKKLSIIIISRTY